MLANTEYYVFLLRYSPSSQPWRPWWTMFTNAVGGEADQAAVF